MPDVACCTAIENSDHPLNQGCGIISIYLKGISDDETKAKNCSAYAYLDHNFAKLR